MSSTNINVGMIEGRNSSRVLKPPGGGHSKIFGDFEEEKPTPKKQQPQSGMMKDLLFQEQEISKTDKNGTATEAENKDNKNIIDNNDGFNKQPAAKRIPPGGFSSGFW